MTTFRHRCIQDLAWVIQSPPLISGDIKQTNWWTATDCEKEYQACLPALISLDHNPTVLEQKLHHAKSYRLGHYFEALTTFWLETSPNYTLLVKQHPIRDKHTTLGEIDFIIRDNRSGEIIHLEVAVKFYLGHNHLCNMGNWHGPELKDRLDLKFNRLRQHQTQLSRKYPHLMPHAVDSRACLLKGRLFYPPGLKQCTTTFSAPQHLRGYWQHSLPEIPASAHNSQKLIHLPKKYWLAPIQNIAQHPATPHHPLSQAGCFALCSDNQEQQRLFVLPDDFWLNVQIPALTAEPAQQ
ncbi:MAG: DUF1853 family protein [Thiolinea sp.]